MIVNGHAFEVLHFHPQTGELDVRWDGHDSRIITCRVPLGEHGQVLSGDDFTTAIMNQCLDRLEHWDRADVYPLDGIHDLVGRTFDVTEAFILRNTPSNVALADDFNLEDHL